MPVPLAAAFKNVNGIKTGFVPTSSMQVRAFLGACNLYRRFIKQFPKIAWPLNIYQKEGKQLDRLHPMTEGLDTISKLKTELVESLISNFSQLHRPYKINKRSRYMRIGRWVSFKSEAIVIWTSRLHLATN